MSLIDMPTEPWMDDHPLRWKCVSRSRSHIEHVQELGHFRGNGSCSCEEFQGTFYKILSRGITPEQAYLQKLVPTGKERDKKHPRDWLRCQHLIDARAAFADLYIEAVQVNEKKHAPSPARRY